MSGRRNIEPYDEENDEIAKEKKIIKAKMAAEAIEEAKKKALAPPPVVSHGHPGSADLEQLMTCCICMDRFRVPKMLPCQHSFCAHCLEDLYNCVKRQVKCPECRTEHHCSNPENFPTNLTMVRFMEVHIEAMGGDPADAMTGPPQMQKCGVCGDNAMLLNCGHCDRKVCTDCRDGHAETLKRELTRLTGQVKRGVVAEALASKGRYARRVESQESTESVSGAGRRQNRAKTSELNDYAVPEPVSNRLFQRETNTPESTGRSANSTRGGTSACEQAINRRRKRFGSVQSQSQDESTLSPAAAAAVYATPSSRPAYTAVSAGRETSPTSTVPSYRRARTPVLDDSDEDLLREAKDREERMPFYSRYLANKAKSREASPTGDYREKSAGRELGASSASSRDSAYLRKGRSSTKLGGRGSEDGQLNWPRGVAVTPNNRVLVADSSNHRVSIYDIEGAFIRSFGSYGSAPGEFDCLAGIAVSSDGKIIVSDRYNHRVSVHDPNGRHLLTFGSEGHLECQFQYPYGVAVSHNSIYVCDKDNARVQKFSLDGRFISKIGGPGVRTNSLNNPHFVCLSPTGDRVFVSDSGNNRIAVFDSRDGSQITSIGGEGTTDGKFQYPRGLAMDENEYLMVGDAGNNRVQIFGNRDYRFVSAFGSWGNVLGEFKGIEGVAVSHDGQILVADRDNHRIQVF